MTIKHLIYQNLKKNIRNYYLYIFALIFSVALYFAFVTLEYDPIMDEMKETVRGSTSIKVGSILLIIIVLTFLLYANMMFLKRRGQEIGLFHLIGMTKRKIFLILSIENAILYFGSLVIGVFFGFSLSKLIMLIMLKVTKVESLAMLRFYPEAFFETAFVFALIYVLVLFRNFIFIRRQSILSLFQSRLKPEESENKLSFLSILIGIIGFGLIILAYYLSSELFSGNFPGYKLFFAMLSILVSMIVGTYLFYKGSVSFIFHLIRKQKDGYLSLNHVLSLTPLMFRIRSNAMLLTVITLVSALAITLLSLLYITYYSTEETAARWSPYDFSLFDEQDVNNFTEELANNQIDYNIHKINIIQVQTDYTDSLVPGSYEHLDIGRDPNSPMSVISADTVSHIELSDNEVLLSEPEEILADMLQFKTTGSIKFSNDEHTVTANFIGIEETPVLPFRITSGFPMAIVHDNIYQQLVEYSDTSVQNEFPVYYGIDIKKSRQLDKANDIFQDSQINRWSGIWEGYDSRLELSTMQKQGVGLTMFIAGFLGLAFLIASGCILYFKQMDESDTERSNYTILRKLGFTKIDLLRGIHIKQLMNFGIPLILGLCHSYFGVKSGWFIFGSEMWTPMLTVMVLYTLIYSIFGVLSVQHYKHVIKDAL